jgi:predicted RNA-binding protein
MYAGFIKWQYERLIVNCYILIKTDGFSDKGALVSAPKCCNMIVDFGYWPLWDRTPNSKKVKNGDKVVIYAGSGACEVLAVAKVEVVDENVSGLMRDYPLSIDGVPGKLLKLLQVERLSKPVKVKEHLDSLDLCPSNKEKWGVALMGGMRKLSLNDFNILARA